MVGAAGTHGDLADPVRHIQHAGRCLGSKPFIDVVMAVEDHIGMGGVELLPEWSGCNVGSTA